MNGMKRPKILPKVVPRYKQAWSVYPDTLMASFDNGKTVRYVIEIKQPEPALRKPLDRFTKLCIGYRYKRKKRAERVGKNVDV